MNSTENRYRRLFECARDGILILNAPTLKITDVNPFMTELLGCSREEFLGKELWEIGLFSDKQASQDAFRELQTKGHLHFEDLQLQTTEGKIREVEFVSDVYSEHNEQIIQCNIRDITDQKRAEEERRQLLDSCRAACAEAETAKGIKDEFLGIVSHELRTPLISILGWSTMLTAGNLDEQDSKRAIESIVRNARAQKQLIDDLLAAARILTGKLRLQVRPIQLAPIVESVVDGVRPAANAKNIDLQAAIVPGISPISGDPERLQQIIWNLLSNAIKFTPEGGRVQLRLEQIDSYVEITVSDTGQGIDPGLLLHVFERFRQAGPSSTRSQGGLGLGLSVVRQLVELHGGTLRAESPGEGKGTTFKVMLPLMSVPQGLNDVELTRPMVEGNALSVGQPLDDLRVLVVDDEPDACAACGYRAGRTRR